MAIKESFEKVAPYFEKGGKYEKFYPVFEMFDTFFYSPSRVTHGASHVRDAADLKRIMITVWMCTFPVMFFGMYNLGLQANTAMAELGLTSLEGWRGAIIGALTSHNPSSVFDNIIYGALHFLPIYITTFAVGIAWEVLFSIKRGHEVNEGFFVTSVLFALTCPPDIPLWMVAIGISFGVVIGKEVFGGTGKNFLNPALTGRAFLYFAYPAAMSGDQVWVAVDGYSKATALGEAALGGVEGVLNAGYSWFDAFLGVIPGSIAETSTLLLLVSASMLCFAGIASYRIILGVVLGVVVTSTLFNLFPSETNPMMAMPFHWHLVLGGVMFGAIFMATDPVSASMTHTGRWIYGFLIGFMTILIRVVNPAFPEGIMLAILFANLFAPTIDHFVVQANIKRRRLRHAK